MANTVAGPQAIISKYNLREDIKKLNLDQNDPEVKFLLEGDPQKGIVAEEYFLEKLRDAVMRAKFAGVGVNSTVMSDIAKKLFISLSANEQRINEQERALILLNKENLSLAKTNPKDPDLASPMGKSTSYIIHDDDYNKSPIGKIFYDGQTLTAVPYHNAYKSGEEKCLRNLITAAKAAYGEGTEVSNPRFNEDKFKLSRDDKSVSKNYYEQQRDLMLASVSNGFKIPQQLEALLESKPKDREMLKEAKEQWKRVVDQRGPDKSQKDQPALEIGGGHQQQKSQPTQNTTTTASISPKPQGQTPQS